MTTPPWLLAAKVAMRIDSRWRSDAARRRAAHAQTYGAPPESGGLARLLTAPADISHWCPGGLTALAETTDLYLQHRFDVLGSGWVHNHYGMRARGLEGHRVDPGPTPVPDARGDWLSELTTAANLPYARKVWQLIGAGYDPIDWHIDQRSGFRWDPQTWSPDIAYGDQPGVDVKVPWELARAHHLPQLALAYRAAQDGGSLHPPEVYWREFRNEVLDFVATNPPGFGVNWSCAMDVAIRISNWLVAYDLFRAHGALPDEEFSGVLLGSALDHGRFLVGNLEWSPALRSNHYLADIAGLLLLAAYAPAAPDVDAWLAFAATELLAETRDQFGGDGGNFEASTSYHRLSGEMVLYATAFLVAVDPNRLHTRDGRAGGLVQPHRGRFARRGPMDSEVVQSHLTRLARIGWFSVGVSRPDGTVPQIGDNDSGRFLKLTPSWRAMPAENAARHFANLCGQVEPPEARSYWYEEALDQRHLAVATGSLLGIAQLRNIASEHSLEGALVDALAGGRARQYEPGVAPGWVDGLTVGDDVVGLFDGVFQRGGHDLHRAVIRPGTSGDSLLAGAQETRAFPDFGLYVLRTRRVYLTFRCGSIGQRGNGGHAHNDHLGIELAIDGDDWFRDPGTYLYTPFPEIRDRYRSVTAHWAPALPGQEPSGLAAGLFRLESDPRCRLIAAGKTLLAGRHDGYGVPTYRSVAIHEKRLEVVDLLPKRGGRATVKETVVTDARGLARHVGAPPFSPSYGVVERGYQQP